MNTFVVLVSAPEGVPLIGEIARVTVEAHHHMHAVMQVRAMRARMRWPLGSRFTPRLLDTLSYERPATLAPLEHAEALSTW